MVDRLVDLPDNVPYSVVQQFISQFALSSGTQGQSGKNSDNLWQGRITAIDHVSDSSTALGTATVLIRGQECHPVRWVSGCEISVGSVVWGIQDARVKIILGVLGTQGTSRMAYNYAPMTGVNFGVDTVIREVPHLGVACGAVKAKTLVRVDWKIWSASGVDNTWWFMLEKSEGAGGTKSRVDQYDFPGGAKAASPGCTMTWITDVDYSNLTMWIACQLPTGTGTLFLSSADTAKNQHSFIIVENLGSMP